MVGLTEVCKGRVRVLGLETVQGLSVLHTLIGCGAASVSLDAGAIPHVIFEFNPRLLRVRSRMKPEGLLERLQQHGYGLYPTKMHSLVDAKLRYWTAKAKVKLQKDYVNSVQQGPEQLVHFLANTLVHAGYGSWTDIVAIRCR